MMTQDTTRKIGIGLLLLLLAMAVICGTKSRIGGWNDGSRMALVESLTVKKTLAIDESPLALDTGDKVFVKGRFYSDKPPMLSVLGAGIYAMLYRQGIRLGGPVDRAYYWITLFTIGLGWFLCAICFYLSLRFTNIKETHKLVLTASLALGTLFFPWSLTFNSHSIAASLLFIGFYSLLKAARSKDNRAGLFGAGFFISLAGTIDYAVNVFYIGFLLHILLEKDLRRSCLYFGLPLLATTAPALAMNYAVTGDFIPINMHKNLFIYPSSPWDNGDGLTGMKINQGIFLARYAFNALIGHYGFFLYNPLLGLSFFCLAREAVRKGKFYKEARVVLAASLMLIAYYLLMSSDYGGYCYGMRWFVPLIPIVFFFTHSYFNPMTLWKSVLFSILLILSLTASMMGAVEPWAHRGRDRCPFVSNLKLLLIQMHPPAGRP